MKIGTSRLRRSLRPQASPAAPRTSTAPRCPRAARRGAGRCAARSTPPCEKPASDDAPGRDAARALARDQRLDLRLRRAHARDVGAVRDVAGRDVVPRAHPETVVERHRAHRRVRKHEADRQRRRQPHLLDDRDEVVAVGAEAVQPDDGGIRMRHRFRVRCRRGVRRHGHPGAPSAMAAGRAFYPRPRAFGRRRLWENVGRHARPGCARIRRRNRRCARPPA